MFGLPFHQEPVYVRYVDENGFRAGQWAVCDGVVWLPAAHGDNPRPARACFVVRFIDDVQDLWPVADVSAMEFSHYLGTPS